VGTTISSYTIGPVILGTADNPLTITNTGTVLATGGSEAIFAAAGTTWTIINAGSVTSQASYGIQLSGTGTATNSGVISGTDGLGFLAGGSLVNGVSGSISGTGTAGSAIHMTGGSGSVQNYGSISAGSIGIKLQAGGSVINGAGGSILGNGDAGVFVNGRAGT
jgi:hypothetical protein